MAWWSCLCPRVAFGPKLQAAQGCIYKSNFFLSCFLIDVGPAEEASSVWHGDQKMFPSCRCLISPHYFLLCTLCYGSVSWVVCCGRDGNSSQCSHSPLWHRLRAFPEGVRARWGNTLLPTHVKALSLSIPAYSLPLCVLLLAAVLSCLCAFAFVRRLIDISWSGF